MTTATRPQPSPPLPHPMDRARAVLHFALDDRLGPGTLQVVPVGATDAAATLGDRGAPDPWAADRPGARVHLTASAVLVGPWGGDGTAPACGRCLAMRWQRLRSRSERDALETGGPDGPRLRVSGRCSPTTRTTPSPRCTRRYWAPPTPYRPPPGPPTGPCRRCHAST